MAVRNVPQLDWWETPTGTWIAHGQHFGYELIHNPSSDLLWPDSTEPLYNVRVWRLHSERMESRICGGYRGLSTAKSYVEQDEANPNAYYKREWFDLIYGNRHKSDSNEEGIDYGV